MSYCSNCGGRLNDNGLCPNCGSVSESKIAPEEKESTQVVACFRALFSPSPLKGVERAARTRSASVWVTFGAMYILTAIMIQFVIFTSLPPEVFHGILDKDMARAMERAGAGEPEKIMPAFASMLTYSAVMAVASLLAVTVMTSMLFVIAKEKPSFSQALNITAFSTFPLSLCALLALPVFILSIPFAVGLLVVGFAMGVVMYYFGIQKASEFDKSPFWFFVLGTFVSVLLLSLLSMVLSMLIF